MGLDDLEFVMALEDTFDITFEDNEIGKMKTPRQTVELITSKISMSDSNVCLSQRSFHLIRVFLQKKYNIERKNIRLTSTINDRIPFVNGKKLWKELKASCQFYLLPDLERPHWMIWLIILVSVSIPTYITIYYRSPICIVLLPLCLFLLFFLSRPFKTHIPKQYKSLKDLILFIIGNNPERFGTDNKGWTRERIRAVVKDVLYEKAGIYNLEYKEDENFYEYYGLG
jgi:acyl carrier protein